MPEGIDDAADGPSVLLTNRPHFLGSGRYGPSVDGLRVGHDEDESRRRASESFRTEVLVLWRLIGDPELRHLYRELSDDGAVIALDLEQFCRAEGGLVERYGFRAAAHGKHRGESDRWF